jgi:hypothetical protein
VAYRDPKTVCGAGWIEPSDLCCEGEAESIDCDGESSSLVFKWTDEQLILAASNLLYARTCYRYPGVCEQVIYPCLDCCSCNRNPCGCGAYYAIELTSDFPILSVESVTINGVELDSSLYRLDENARVVKTDGLPWPTSNNLGLPLSSGSASEEVVVSYATGREPPVELKMACAELVCELKKACNGGNNCALPAHVRSVARRGVDIEVHDVVQLLAQGLTGNPIIDHALTVHGRCRKARMFDALRSTRNVRHG